MKNESQILRLVEKANNNKICSLFNQFHEKFESKNFSRVIVTTKEQFDCVSLLTDCLDKFFFKNDNMNCHFDKFLQSENINSLTYVEFEFCDEHDHINVLLRDILVESEEIKKQTNTVIIKLPTTENLSFEFNNSFNKTFVSTNLKNESFLIFTNNVSLIELYELL